MARSTESEIKCKEDGVEMKREARKEEKLYVEKYGRKEESERE